VKAAKPKGKAPSPKGGRPRKDDAAAEGLKLVAEGLTIEDAGAALRARGVDVSDRTLRRAVDASKRAAAPAKLVQLVRRPAEPLAPLPKPPEPTTHPRQRLEQVHRLVLARWQAGAPAADGHPARPEEGWGPRTGAMLAAELGLDAEGLRGLLLEVEALEVAGRLPPELARAQSIAVYVAVEAAARAAGNLPATMAARAKIDRLRGLEGKGADATAARAALEALARAVAGLPRDVAVPVLRQAAAGLGEEATAEFRDAVRASQNASGGSAA
jgi:hypothetical protein